MEKLLRNYLLSAEIEADNSKIDRFVAYVNLLNKWNKAYNLTSVRDPMDMISRHIMDSLVIGKYLSGTNFADVGSGPGLPGIPLAILYESKKFTLIDSRSKRSVFQLQAAMELNLTNVEIVNSRVEELRSEHFDGIISRAFASLTDFSNLCASIADQETLFYAMKGQLNPNETEALNDKIISVKELTVPGCNAKRHLIIFKA
jgi:16S rRNA (guanine527-N7)-methyltransferase